MSKIDGGYTIWARQIEDSEIFMDKPATWFKIWFYIVNHVNWSDGGKYPRGVGYFNYSNLKDSVFKDISPDVYKKCIHFLKVSTMISTTKSTRGMKINVLNYGIYQCPNNYEAPQKAPTEAQQKHNRSTTITKEEKKERNNNINIEKKLIKKNQIKTYTEDKLTIEEVAKKLQDHYEAENGKKSMIPPNGYKNLASWLEVYQPNDIATAISQIKYDKYWGKGGKGEGGMSLVLLFRQRNQQNEPVDYIGNLLNSKKEYTNRRI